jgi:8-oxo-dGTP pyrophosphatase MutT (NUDIX family)
MPTDAQVAEALPPNVRPRDAATLILIDRTDRHAPRILMGRRSMRHVFMPGAYVFPGGRVDRGDLDMTSADDFPPTLLDKLLVDMKRGASARRARALGLAAIRETWEEVGLMLGAPSEEAAPRVPDVWRPFGEMRILPRLSDLRFVGRATTPPRRARRFDTRFFAAFSDAIAHRIPVERLATQELEDVCWLTFADARQTNLPGVTLRMIDHLEKRLTEDPDLDPRGGVPYYFTRRGKLNRQEI